MNETANGVEPGSAEPAGLMTPSQPTTSVAPELRPLRLRSVNRQLLLPAMTLDQLIEPDHPARDVWRFVENLDLTLLYNSLRARANAPGRPPIDPRILVALWLYAYLCGFTSARQLATLAKEYNPFRWIAGGVSVSHHTLSTFLVGYLDFLEQLFKHSVEVFRSNDLLDLGRVAQDGMRVRASVGAASFRRRATLEKLLHEAEQEVQRLLQELAQADKEETSAVTEPEEVAVEKAGPSDAAQKPSAQQRAAPTRVAEERLTHARQALERLPEMEAKKKAADKKEARVSTTDPEATVMKMGDGGYRPAYNVQYSTTCVNQIRSGCGSGGGRQ